MWCSFVDKDKKQLEQQQYTPTQVNGFRLHGLEDGAEGSFWQSLLVELIFTQMVLRGHKSNVVADEHSLNEIDLRHICFLNE